MATILLIEDNAGSRDLYRTYLQNEGYKVLEAEDGNQGLDLAASNEVDLVLTDIFMPEKDGYETIKSLRDQDKEIPIIAISGKEEKYKYSLHVASILGADLVLKKSVKKSELLGAIQSLLTN